MHDIGEPSVLVQRLHQLAVQNGYTIKEMAEKCSLPKSSLEGYMRLKGAKRPGVDALMSIADTMGVSIDWLVGRSDGKELSEGERRRIAIAIHRLVIEILTDIETAQSNSECHVVADGKIGGRDIGHYATAMMLHFMTTQHIFPGDSSDTWQILDEVIGSATK